MSGGLTDWQMLAVGGLLTVCLVIFSLLLWDIHRRNRSH